MPLLELLCVGLLLASAAQALAFCPNGCSCDDETLVVTCRDANLDVIPITLNPSIQRLDLKNNRIKTVDSAFQFYGELQYVDLANNHLFNISENAFRGLTRLRNLGLADNRLGAIPTRQLAVMTRLEELSVGQNEFQTLEANAFQGLTNLRRLDVSGASQLEKVEKGALKDNLNLEALTLSSNKRLAQVEEGALTGLPNLRNLVLRDNAFTTFPESLVAWPELHKVDLAENPIQCSCALLWLRELLVRRNASHVLCASPVHLKERSLRALSPDELGCAFHDTRQQIIIGAICGLAVSIVVVICFLLYHFRRPVQDMLKDYKWNNRAISRKEHEYQKTFSDDDYIVRAAQQPALKPIPVTEL
ncbi:UNVERIFIED_CONTAM: hypothetical protein PYX00_006576 [Menopon gallinae]|uniref:LRRCT domain-containing protein n=1 Tax=Menopon gallinae TaxID=328185 RepID=A0AAW2HW96_9NEOP